ncbi:protein of unknown function [Candidatus Hydrogenisulfobacillus filiaventi]|uniref:Uncharacterized protein n=1 Tax=Candidatus Hydrogenisulfobacillus filiaventi TaxID=2707344 RepID=A0A6F8ZHA0_9FIRM|nr:hypothetical protein [Bacillota bacterium]CAB1129032.1 protein of unknown function [Candidatus Hydrogenisulfobacillus filiaventi]
MVGTGPHHTTKTGGRIVEVTSLLTGLLGTVLHLVLSLLSSLGL